MQSKTLSVEWLDEENSSHLYEWNDDFTFDRSEDMYFSWDSGLGVDPC